MAQIISATTRFAGSGAGTRQADFLSRARALLAQAVEHRAAGRWDLALEAAFQAALRTAGARIAMSSVSSRRRRPTSAWDQLRLVDEAGERWADTFVQYSRLRSRVSSGLELDVDHVVVSRVLDLAGEFLAEVEGEVGWFPAAA
ncbi:MAG: SAV_6107 family HEPN domain-containing protein [Corynebacterium sp.]|uniref:SAV_6107 family HEPN domain-containing protein n=1 Tax=Corynebacterium sp. TaxID=1720 RepID=UPI0026DFB11B|nr:SAV_6107 family HEPN domain-containing protein [Corynebacterium sp.]MDO5668814.1 SAV_6107 family HEPN domain-containing protein [Corynebacterium sp.]